MAHIAHYKMDDVKRLTNEFEREKECNNSDGRIDESRTKNNYSIPPRRTHYQLCNDVGRRLNQVNHSKRKDLNVISVWVITCPQEIKDDPVKTKQFFDTAYAFCQTRYGMENVMCGYVHMDESTPHMHVPVMPVKEGRISSKAVFTRGELSGFHKDLDKVMEAEFGLKHLMLNGRTKGNYTVKELKERDKREAKMQASEAALDAREASLKAQEEALRERANNLALLEQNAANKAKYADDVRRDAEAKAGCVAEALNDLKEYKAFLERSVPKALEAIKRTGADAVHRRRMSDIESRFGGISRGGIDQNHQYGG